MDLVKSDKVTEIVTEELSRLDRNTIDVLLTLKEIEEQGVRVTVRNMGNLTSNIDDKKNPIWNLLSSLMISLYQNERENLLERTSVGRKMYVLNGGELGRPAGTNESDKEFLDKPKNQQIKSLLEKGKSVRDIAGRLGVSSRTIIKLKKIIEA
jgi:DNA invertase Pin-like site-specific DNA recombinase